MPKIKINRCQYHYEVHGTGTETLVFSHGLLWSGHMFYKQVDHLKDRYKIVTYDHRGQGQSEVTQDGYDMDSLYNDAVGLIESLKLGAVHFGGLSMGGFVAMRLAARAQDEPNKVKYNLLKTIVKIFGVNSVVNPVMNIMFGRTFMTDPGRYEERIYWTNQLKSNDETIVRAVSGVIDRKGVEDELANIQCPTLILVGEEDTGTVPEKSEFIQSKIPQSRLKYIKRAGHTACIEQSIIYNREIERFLSNVIEH
jgi:pimeloyl-ACP methyl ester carboxylesterase